MRYLKGLNALRFFAALFVLLGHAKAELEGLQIHHLNLPFFYIGQDAVDFFFVLSGFLLTYIALTEAGRTGRFSVSRFYRKRMLRIWPLYFLCVVLGVVLLGYVVPAVTGKPFLAFNIGYALPLYILFLPNYVIAAHSTGVGALSALWTIGVEEQFYLFFPLLVLALLRSKRPLVLLAVITVLYTVPYFLAYYHVIPLPPVAYNFVHTLKFYYMFFGSMGAVLYLRHRAIVQKCLPDAWVTQALLLCGAMFIVCFNINVNYAAYNIATAVLFVAIIINTFSSTRYLVNFEQPWLSYLGKISFGIYMFHPYLSYPLRLAILKLGWVRDMFTAAPWLYYIVLLGLTIGVAHLSYKYFESRFLHKKV